MEFQSLEHRRIEEYKTHGFYKQRRSSSLSKVTKRSRKQQGYGKKYFSSH